MTAVRILPLGGLGEIGKNMTVVEYGDEIVVVDTGLMFPTSEMLGIDLVLPDFSYLRGRADDIQAIVLTHGHEDHVGALPFVLREIFRSDDPHAPDLRRRADDRPRALEARGAQDPRRAARGSGAGRPRLRLGSFELELIHMAHSIPDSCAVVLRTELGPILITGDYKFDQTPVDGNPADVSRLAALGAEGLLCLCGDSTNADRPGIAPSESSVGPRPAGLDRALRGPHHRHLVRLQRPSGPAGHRRRCAARPQGGPRGPLDAQELQHRLGTLGSPTLRTACSSLRREIESFPDHKVVAISTGSQGEPLSALRRMAHADHPRR